MRAAEPAFTKSRREVFKIKPLSSAAKIVGLRLRSTSNISLTHLFSKVFRSSHRQRHNRHRWVLPSRADEAGAIDNEQILDVMALTPFIQHTGLRIIAHPAGAKLMDAIAPRIWVLVLRETFEARGLGQRNTGIHRIASHIEFIIG